MLLALLKLAGQELESTRTPHNAQLTQQHRQMCTFAGALTFLHWKMYRCFAGYSHTYTASYYRSRLSYYGFLAIMTGLVQLSLGKIFFFPRGLFWILKF